MAKWNKIMNNIKNNTDMENEENKELIEPAEQVQEENNDKVIDSIQNKMNAMEVKKRKRIMIIFIMVFVLFSFFKMATAMKGCTSDKESRTADTTQTVKEVDSIAMMQQILETPIVKESKRDPHLEEYMEKLVEENRKENEYGKE